MRAEQAVAQAFARASGTAEAYVLVLQAIVESLGWQLGAAWEPLPTDEHTVRCVAVWAVPGERTDEFAQVTRTTELRSGEGLPGRVWRNGRTAWITDFATTTAFPRREAAAAAGLHAAFAFPLRSERGVVGVIEFFASGSQEPDEQLLGTMEVLGMQMGQLVERRRAEESQYSIEQRHQATLEAALDCVVTMDDAGRVIEFNPAACRVFGFTAGRGDRPRDGRADRPARAARAPPRRARPLPRRGGAADPRPPHRDRGRARDGTSSRSS